MIRRIIALIILRALQLISYHIYICITLFYCNIEYYCKFSEFIDLNGIINLFF